MHKSRVLLRASRGGTKGKEAIMEVLVNNPGPNANNEGGHTIKGGINIRDKIGWCYWPMGIVVG